MATEDQPVGMLAGAGRPPFLAAEGIRATGRPLVVLALYGLASPRLKHVADVFHWVSIARLGSWIRLFHRHQVREAVVIGSVHKHAMYSPLRIVRYIPDLRTVRFWYGTLRKDKRDNAILLAIDNEMRNEGIEINAGVKFCEEHLAGEGPMTNVPLSGETAADVEFGWRIARASAAMDIGQSIAVKERDIIAVEAMEGTDAMIARAGQLCRSGGWTMVKVARPDQDMRFDVPTVGPGTIRNLKNAGCACLVLEAGCTFIVDKPVTLQLAEKYRIAVVGKRPEDEGRALSP